MTSWWRIFRDRFAILLVLFGGLAFLRIGWTAVLIWALGVLLFGSSPIFRVRVRLLGLLVPPGGFLALLLFYNWTTGIRIRSCVSEGVAVVGNTTNAVTHCHTTPIVKFPYYWPVPTDLRQPQFLPTPLWWCCWLVLAVTPLVIGTVLWRAAPANPYRDQAPLSA